MTKSKQILRNVIAITIYLTASSAPAFAQFSTGGDNYETLPEAVAAVVDGGTITMLQDHVMPEYVPLSADKTFTIDLGGHTFSSIYGTQLRITAGTVTIQNGSISGTGDYGIYALYPANTILDGLTVSGAFNAVANNGGTMSILSGNYFGKGNVVICYSGTIIITAGHFVSTNDWGDSCFWEFVNAEIALAAGSSANVNPWKEDGSATDVTITAGGTGVANTQCVAPRVAGYYSIMGQKLQEEPQSGIYIIMYDNGKTEKVIKKN